MSKEKKSEEQAVNDKLGQALSMPVAPTPEPTQGEIKFAKDEIKKKD